MRNNYDLAQKVVAELHKKRGEKTSNVDGGKPLHHSQLEKIRRHVFDTTSSHSEAHTKMKALISAHKAIYSDDDDDGKAQ